MGYSCNFDSLLPLRRSSLGIRFKLRHCTLDSSRGSYIYIAGQLSYFEILPREKDSDGPPTDSASSRTGGRKVFKFLQDADVDFRIMMSLR